MELKKLLGEYDKGLINIYEFLSELRTMENCRAEQQHNQPY